MRIEGKVGTAGSERVDELARRVTLTKKTSADYDKFPLSYAKKVIKSASLEEWQEQYVEGSTGEITKCFSPRIEQAYKVLRQIDITSQLAPTLMGHGEFAQYLFRFYLKDSPYCVCDPPETQDVLHVLEECDIFLRGCAALEAGPFYPLGTVGNCLGAPPRSGALSYRKKNGQCFLNSKNLI
ncbi:Retrovirus-related Pol polyprotein from type-1 retrotransposable element R1 3 [Eumeta japonica]|uniref:Retrovirus-related Pol polyprotein from type-1 retrotransposable element R1 3 n=1 Tax=Eumeta variegata TaxID=151549 RepID=A0A4C1V531_EUMVA|nr:Retrovirus-related Pol polyprotein from type-1 retrotransposable element R1 3 [Eumeta japonica]